MMFDFDHPPARPHTDSQKWQKYAGKDILPMWVADMDFAVAPAIVEALHRRVDHGIFGYARPTKSTVDSVVDVLSSRYGWAIDPAWLVWLPGLVVGLNVTAQAFAAAGDEVLTLSPVYPPFVSAPRNSGRVPVQVKWKLNTVIGDTAQSAARWEINWGALEQAVSPRTKMFFLCNPHNPIARVWRRDELIRLTEFCLRHDLILCSDEIHADLILEPTLSHISTGTLGSDISKRLLTLVAPSKTYNIPGLGTSLAIIPDATLRAKFVRATAGIVAEVTSLGYAACEAAYREGEPWRQELLAYLRTNRDLVVDYVHTHLPGVQIEAPVEATYLAWLNVEQLKLPDPVAHFEAHGVGLSDGAFFGSTKGHHVRLNFGCPRATLAEALQRIKRAVESR
jgi:cystathionine beta-lyase